MTLAESVAAETQHREQDVASASWHDAHTALSRLARQRCAADAEEGRWLLRAVRTAAHVYLGFGSFSEYIERLFGYQPRSLREKLRVAEALEQLPVLRRALEQGELSWSAVRELTRVAVSDNERRWLELGRGKTVRQLEELVVGKHEGDDPDSPPDASVQRRVLRFEVEAETFACFREAMAELRRRSGAPVDDDSALLEMSRLVLAGPRDEGRSSYQVALSVCPTCGAGRQSGDGELVPVGTEIVGMACCDAQHVGYIAGDTGSATHGTLSELRAEHTDAAEERIAPANQNNGTQLEPDETHAAAHVGLAVSPRARQSIPPALRRAVLLRDQHRCRVPGCRHASYLDLHHIQLRSEGGPNSAENILSVCSSHHRALHRGELHVEGTASVPTFRHADGGEYGLRTEPLAAEAQSKAFQALRGLGFREAEIRTVLGQLRQDARLNGAPVQRLLREALVRIRLVPSSLRG